MQQAWQTARRSEQNFGRKTSVPLPIYVGIEYGLNFYSWDLFTPSLRNRIGERLEDRNGILDKKISGPLPM